MALSHSFSALKLYENCPLRYYEQRIKKSVEIKVARLASTASVSMRHWTRD
jgi:hypothetical protein